MKSPDTIVVGLFLTASTLLNCKPMTHFPLPVHNILVPTDFSDCADHALEHALDLAQRFDAAVHILHVVDKLDPGWYGLDEVQESAPQLRKRIRDEARKALKARAEDNGLEDEIETHISLQLSFDVAATIEEYVNERYIDLLVMGTHGRRGIERMMLGNVADKVVRHISCPVLTVTERAPWNTGQPVNDVLAPIDFSTSSEQALKVAEQFADAYDARVHLLFVGEKRAVPTFSDTGLPGISYMEMDPEIVANAEKALLQLHNDAGRENLSVTTAIKHGHAANQIIDYAESHGVGLIVMATRGLTGMSHFLLGSTTERVVRAATCPVLTFHAEDDEDE